MSEWIVEITKITDEIIHAIRVTELVRCKDCVHGCAYNEKWYLPKRDAWWCTLEEKEVDIDFFCKSGERRSE